VGELSAAYAKDAGLSDQNAVALAKTMSAVAGLLVGGGNNVAAVNVAAQTGANAAQYNRMLHPTETQKAKELAAQSGGKYTAQQIEEQMRLMGNAAYREPANKTEVLTTTQAIANNITQDPSMPKATDGKTVVEVPGQANVEIQQFIMANTKEGADYIPGQSPYSASNAALNQPTITNTPGDTMATAACANGDLACKSGVGVQQNAPLTQQTREAIADGAAGVSRQAGVIAAGATAATAAASPQVKPITAAVATGATVIGVAADAVEQMVRPDTGQTVVNLIGTASSTLIEKLPGGAAVAPITNEIVEGMKQGVVASDLSNKVNEAVKQATEALK
jgi:filamentous hemagglutinin